MSKTAKSNKKSGKNNLVIVESPAKARTIEKYLGKDFRVVASVGHVRDLPKSKLGVDLDKGFEPEYVTIRGKKKVLDDIKAFAKSAENLYLATDPDREGEAIAWHVIEYLKPKDKRVHRATFQEITRPAVQKAIADPGELNMDLCMAQQARRVLDRLVGYQISPLLWKNVRRGLSAGRVQSVAVRILCEREEEIEAFEPEEYWNLDARVEGSSPPAFLLRLKEIDGEKARVRDGDAAQAVLDAVREQPFRVGNIEKKPVKRNPQPPFITSTLQQEAARKLHFSPQKTMSVAQGLYEGVEIGDDGATGLITYMRTDSVRVSDMALNGVRAFIGGAFGEAYLPEKPRAFRGKKGAQDAHEAIRPTLTDRPPESLKSYLNDEQMGLYQLIWNRFVASQMAAAELEKTTVNVPLSDGKYVFSTTGTVITFPGFLSIYEEDREKDDAERTTREETADQLPALEEGQELQLHELLSEQKFTQPPSRFSMSSLIRELERRGIGRPSTYASILSTIQDKEYVERVEGYFRPTDLGKMVTDILKESFPEILDVAFTAKMEEELDEIEEGKRPWLDVMREFYGSFEQRLQEAETSMRSPKAMEEPTDIPCEKCGAHMVIKWGKNGKFLACSKYPDCKNTKQFSRNDAGEIVVEEMPETTEKCEKCGGDLVVKRGRHGMFLACSNYPDCKNTRPIEDIQDGKAIAAEALPDTDEVCEKCGSPMAVKNSRRGPFLACTAFPKCRNAKDIGEVKNGKAVAAQPVETGETCEKCGSAMVVKNGRRGPFLACSGYPKCKNAQALPDDHPAMAEAKKKAPARKKAAPTDIACEKCGKPMVLRDGKRGPFLGCSGYPTCRNIVDASEEVVKKFGGQS